MFLTSFLKRKKVARSNNIEYMKKQTIKNKKVSTATKVAIGVGAVALGASAYALMGPNGKKNQKKVKDWAMYMKKEVTTHVKKFEQGSKKEVEGVIDMLAKTYAQQYKEHAPQIKAVSKALKGEWSSFVKTAKPVVKKTTTQAKKVVATVKKTEKKVVKKVIQKVAPKVAKKVGKK